MVQFLTFGWSLNHDGRPVTITMNNHKTAMDFQTHVTEYILKEISHDCLLGLFASVPWKDQVAVSPMSTRSKKSSTKRRIIMDLSWPLDGTAVNEGISGENYLGQIYKIQYPTVDLLCKRANKLGKGVMGYKRDLDRAFKQLPANISDWPLTGISWFGAILFDKTTVMGCKSAPYSCQRTTSFIRHIMKNLKYFMANYVDDLMGLEMQHKVWNAYTTLGNLLRDLGAKEAEDKAVPPTYHIEFLGVLFDLINMTIGITPERLQELSEELETWTLHKLFTRRELESLLGKLQFISNCVRPGRVMVLRLRNGLKNMQRTHDTVSQEMYRDIDWWRRFIRVYDRVSIMWMEQIPQGDALIATDACLTGMGATCMHEFIHCEFPKNITNTGKYKIHHLEMVALTVAVKVWSSQCMGKKFTVLCDNSAVVDIIRSGYSRDTLLQSMLRELMYVASVGKFEIVTKLIGTRENRLPDLLSRWHLHEKYRTSFNKETGADWKEIKVPQTMFKLDDFW